MKQLPSKNIQNVVRLLQNANNIKTTLESSIEIEKRFKNIQSGFTQLTNWYNDLVKENKQQYPKIWDSVKYYLRDNGKLMPIDDMDFFYWFLEIRHPDLSFGQPLPIIERVDFEYFHQYQEADIKSKLETVSTPQEIVNDVINEKFSLKTLAVLHVYLSLYEAKPVTKQNQDSLAKKYGYNSASSGIHLYNNFKKYKQDTERLKLHTESKRADKEHLKRFEDILPLLETQSKQGFIHAKLDLGTLKAIYEKYYPD